MHAFLECDYRCLRKGRYRLDRKRKQEDEQDDIMDSLIVDCHGDCFTFDIQGMDRRQMLRSFLYDCHDGTVHYIDDFEHEVFIFPQWNRSLALTTSHDRNHYNLYSYGMVGKQEHREYNLFHGGDVRLSCTKHYRQYDTI